MSCLQIWMWPVRCRLCWLHISPLTPANWGRQKRNLIHRPALSKNISFVPLFPWCLVILFSCSLFHYFLSLFPCFPVPLFSCYFIPFSPRFPVPCSFVSLACSLVFLFPCSLVPLFPFPPFSCSLFLYFLSLFPCFPVPLFPCSFVSFSSVFLFPVPLFP